MKLEKARQTAELARLEAEVAMYHKQAEEAAAGNAPVSSDSNSAWEEVYDDYGYV